MRMTIDLRLQAPPAEPESGHRVLTPADLVVAARSPRELWALLRGTRWDEVRILEDDGRRSGAEAGAIALAGMARAARFALEQPSRGRTWSGPSFRAWSAGAIMRAFAAEAVLGAAILRRARRVTRTPFVLPPPRGRPRSVSYLRAEPSLRWMGLGVGGAATHTAGVVNGLAGEGLDVRVFAPEPPAGIDGVPCTAVAVPAHFSLVPWLTPLRYSATLAGAAADRPVDAVYQRYAMGSYAGLELARRLGVPLILEYNGSEVWAKREWGSGRMPLASTLVALELRNLRDATLVVVVSDPLRDVVIAHGVEPRRALMARNGVDIEALAGVRDAGPVQWRRRLGLPEAPTIGFIGTFGRWHGSTVLPAVIAAVAAEAPEARWLLVGDGPLHAQVAAELADRGMGDVAGLPGLVPRERALQLLGACEVCVSPHVPNSDGSPFFGSPTKLFEYMGLARAIVASDLDQIGEVIEHERTGLLVTPGDVGETAAAVLRLLADGSLRDRLGAAALARAQERHGWDAHARRILDAVEALSAG
jgi:glycosyltransferase involved in cell wall biosynthesis